LQQEVKIIGRGTWLDRVADEVISREKKLGRSLTLIRVESGIAASGTPHIGNVGDAIRSYGVKMALESAGFRSELIAFSDDFDGLRRVPAGYPEWLKDYLAHPVSKIPDPFGCHESYGAHAGALLRESLDRLGIHYTFISGAEAYREGLLNEQIKRILENSQVIGKKIREMVGQTKYEQVLPYTPVCKNCGRIYTTHVYSYDPKTATVSYTCENTELGHGSQEGCGHRGTAKVTDGEGKLAWKSEFAARWAALDIRFEAIGKEIADSVRVNDWICENILNFPPPLHVRYELFQDKTGRKISKSTGNLVTPQEWLNCASPESLRLLMFKRIVGARNISLDDVPTYMDEFDDLEDYYFSEKRDENTLKDARLRGLYEYSSLLNHPKKKRDHVPYRLLAQLASLAPEGRVEEYVVKRLISYGMVRATSEDLLKRIWWAFNWAKREGAAVQTPREFAGPVAKSLAEFAERVADSRSGEEVQGFAFEVIKKYGLKATDFFPAIYSVLVGSERGPRLGPYVIDVGAEQVAQRIREALASSSTHN
jgi:lysyl-tRNA synthetase class 1